MVLELLTESALHHHQSQHYYGIDLFSISEMYKLSHGARSEFFQRPKTPEITARKPVKSPVRITAPKKNSKTISVMWSLRYGGQN